MSLLLRGALAAAVAVLLLPLAGPPGSARVPAARQAADSLWALSFTTGPGWRAELAPGAQDGFGSHSRNLGRLRAEGRILVGGRFAEWGLMLVRAGSEAEVRRMLEPDSSLAAGTFRVVIAPWRTVYPGTVPAR